MQELRCLISRRSSWPEDYATAETPSSASNMLGYLYRRLTDHDSTVTYLNERDHLDQTIIFEDIASLSPESLYRIAKEAAEHKIDIVDINFDRLPNVLDFARGDAAVHEKLDRMLVQTKQVMSNQPDVTIEQAVEKTLQAPADALLSRLSARHGLRIIRPEAVSVQEAFQERVQASDIKAFLETNILLSHIEERMMAAEVLADDVEFHSIGTIIDRLKPLHEAVEASARKRNLEPELDRFIIDVGGFGSSSDALMTYLYSQVNGINASRIMTHKQYLTITPQTRETLRPVLVDDAIYSGFQMQTKAEGIDHPRTTVATLSSYNEFGQYMDKQRREFDDHSLRKTILDSILFRTKPSSGVLESPQPAFVTESKKHRLSMKELSHGNREHPI